jgi:hypothetical protein
MCKEWKPWADYVGHDLFGYEYNRKYPPNKEMFGNDFGGYATPNQETFFYDYCIQQYGVVFSYEEVSYETEFTNEGPILRNITTQKVQGPFDDAVQLLEKAIINGRKMIDILDNLQNIVLH